MRRSLPHPWSRRKRVACNPLLNLRVLHFVHCLVGTGGGNPVTKRTLVLLPVICAVLVAPGVLGLSAQSGESVDLEAIQRIKEEGLERSQVMDTAPRYTVRG
jgi:hypothetical protein